MPDEVITAPVQNSGGARAAAVFLSAHVLQLDNLSDDFRDDFRTVASSFAAHRGAMLPRDEVLQILVVRSAA
jgi:hypothetical protein